MSEKEDFAADRLLEVFPWNIHKKVKSDQDTQTNIDDVRPYGYK